MKGWVGTIFILAVAYLIVTYVFGLNLMSLSVYAVIAFAGILLVLKPNWFTKYLPMSAKGTKIVGVVAVLVVIAAVGIPLLGFGSLGFDLVGMITGGLPAGSLTGPVSMEQAQASATACKQGLTAEQLDDAASVTLNAYDVQASGGRGTAVDLTTNCWLYKDGNTVNNFQKATSDTADATESTTWTIGDSAYIYCGGTSYYSVPVEGKCIDSKTVPISWDIYAITTAATGPDSSAFDNEKNALTAAGNTTVADYDLTLAASQEETIYVKLKQSIADKAFNLLAVATATFNDIDYVMPSAGQGFSEATEPAWLHNVKVSDDGESGNTTVSYTVYKLSSPVLLKEFESVMYQFQVKAGASDPSATDNVFSTLDAGIICFLDGQYAKGVDGNIYLDIHDHAQAGSEGNVGYDENELRPVGGYECLVIEGN